MYLSKIPVVSYVNEHILLLANPHVELYEGLSCILNFRLYSSLVLLKAVKITFVLKAEGDFNDEYIIVIDQVS